MLRASTVYRRTCFDEGLQSAGFKVVERVACPEPGDVVVTWNAYAGYAEEGERFRRAGARHLVIENGLLGKTWRGGEWFSIALDAVAMTGGEFRPGGPERWDSWAMQLHPWRTGGETLILGQRGIGHPDVRSPPGWAESTRARIGGRIRQHPGTGPATPLGDDLDGVGRAVTWSSAAALQALLLGVPVWHAHPRFVGAQACRPLADWGAEPKRDDATRLAVFRRLAWAIWTLDEIRTGEPIRRLLDDACRTTSFSPGAGQAVVG